MQAVSQDVWARMAVVRLPRVFDKIEDLCEQGKARMRIGKLVPRPLKGPVKALYSRLLVASMALRGLAVSRDLEMILMHHSGVKEIIIFVPSVEWNVSLFQRPQQMALALARQGCLVFYCEPLWVADYPFGFTQIRERLILARVPTRYLHRVPSPVAIALANNKDALVPIRHARVVYEYIDELDVLSGDWETLQDNHAELVEQSAVVVVSAERLLEKVRSARPDAVLCPNGVDYDFVHSAVLATTTPPREMAPFLRPGTQVIGYYGALADWFDYELLEHVAQLRPSYQFVLIGPDYDGSILKSRIHSLSNIHWLGTKPYAELPSYLKHFDVATIPFKINEITQSVSPIKLYEYMAGGKPVVTTPMHECLRHPEVLTAAGPDEFAAKLDVAIRLGRDAQYSFLIDRIARDNTWDERAALLLRSLDKTKGLQ